MTCKRTTILAGGCMFLAGCVGWSPPPPPAPLPAQPSRYELPRIGFSIQVGAFADIDNAIRLSEMLADLGLEPFHFADDDGLYKVRCGDFSDRETAVARAEFLREEYVIDEYYIVPPFMRSGAELRRRIVHSAMSLLGRPYRWGSSTPEVGVDCSGLTMTAYRLNGLALPRTSAAQYAAGGSIPALNIREADLVFFATENGDRPSHVGLYVGHGRFIHAPGRGKVVRVDDLSESYWTRCFLSARSYLQ